MKKKYLYYGMAVVALGLTTTSCSRDDGWSSAKSLDHASSVLGVDIDSNQDWKMVHDVAVNVSVNYGTGEEYTVYVFDKSPFDNDDAVYFSKKTMPDGATIALNVSVPLGVSSLYVSVFDSNKKSYSKKIAINGNVARAVFQKGA